MNNASALLSLQNVTKTYGRERVLTVDSLELYRHQSVLLHGRNGSGKSTLLRILAGISSVDGGVLSHHPVLKNLRLGFLPQSGGLYSDLTLRENLRVRRRLYGLTDIPPTGLWYIDDLGLSPYLDRQVSQLSGGFQRLSAIAALLHAAPRWLLLDEPLSGVDTDAQALLRERFADLAKRLDLCVVAAPTKEGELVSGHRIVVSEGRIA